MCLHMNWHPNKIKCLNNTFLGDENFWGVLKTHIYIQCNKKVNVLLCCQLILCYTLFIFSSSTTDMQNSARRLESSPDMPMYVSEHPCTEVCQSQTKYLSYDLHELKIYRNNPPIRRFVYKTGAVFGPFPGRILLLLNYKTG